MESAAAPLHQSQSVHCVFAVSMSCAAPRLSVRYFSAKATALITTRDNLLATTLVMYRYKPVTSDKSYNRFAGVNMGVRREGVWDVGVMLCVRGLGLDNGEVGVRG